MTDLWRRMSMAQALRAYMPGVPKPGPSFPAGVVSRRSFLLGTSALGVVPLLPDFPRTALTEPPLLLADLERLYGELRKFRSSWAEQWEEAASLIALPSHSSMLRK